MTSSSPAPSSSVMTSSALQIPRCGNNFPLSDDFFHEITDVERGFVTLCGIMTFVTILCFGEQAYFVLRYYETRTSIKYKSVRILGVYPVMSLTALLAVCVPRATLVCDMVGSIYLATSLFNFTNLILDYLGGLDALVNQFQGEKIRLQSPPLACCCPCLPKIDINRKNLIIIRLLVFQTVVLQPLIGFLTVVLWMDQKYHGKMKADNAFPYLAVPRTISTVVAMYGLIMVFRVSRKALWPLHIRPKFLVLQLIMVFHCLQSLLFAMLEKQDLPECRGPLSSRVRGLVYKNMLMVGEMMVLAVVARCFYRRPHGNLALQAEGLNDDSKKSLNVRAVSIVSKDAISTNGDTPRSNENTAIFLCFDETTHGGEAASKDKK